MSTFSLPLTPMNAPTGIFPSAPVETPEILNEVVTQLVPHRKKGPKSAQTVKKLIRGQLFRGLMNLSWKAMETLVAMIVNLLLFVITSALQAENCRTYLSDLQIALEHQTPTGRCVAAQTTAIANMKRHTEQSLFETQIQNAITYLEKYQAEGRLPHKLILAVDMNCKEMWGKVKNQYSGWMKKGQTEVWMRSKNREGFFFANVPIFIAECLITTTITPRSHRALPVWIQKCSELLIAFERAGFPIAVILGDRGYFEALGFAFAGLKLWRMQYPLKNRPIFMTPRQFSGRGGGKKNCKWDWLIGNDPTRVYEYQMKLHYDDRHLIPNVDSILPRTQKRDGYLVRTIQVFSLEGNRKEPARTWAWAHARALAIQERLDRVDREYRKKLNLYRYFYRKVQKKPLKKVPQFKSEVSKPRYKDERLEQRYQALAAAVRARNRIRLQKMKLINKVFVTILSVDATTPVAAIQQEYCELVHLYALRWGIENAFKAMKEDFIAPSANSSQICYLFARVTSAALWNEYHYSQFVAYVSNLDAKGKSLPAMTAGYGEKAFFLDPNNSPVLSRMRWKMMLFEKEMKDWLNSLLPQ